MQRRFEKIQQWFRNNFSEHDFHSAGGGRIRFMVPKQRQDGRTVIIVSGRTEFIEKYMEVVFDLRDTPLNFCLYDHHGQGGSTRPLNDPQKGHVSDFTIYLKDLGNLIERLALPPQEKVYLLAHSMGGAIAALFAAQNRGVVAGLLLLSPMFQINTRPLPPLLVEMLARLACLFGLNERYVPGGGPFNSDLPFENNALTGDRDRFERNIHLVEQDPRLAVGSPTIGWLLQAYKAMRLIRRDIKELDCPVILLQPLDDRVVDLGAMEKFCRSLDSCNLVKVKGARHELLMEQDRIRGKVVDIVFKFTKEAK